MLQLVSLPITASDDFTKKLVSTCIRTIAIPKTKAKIKMMKELKTQDLTKKHKNSFTSKAAVGKVKT